VRTPNPRRTIGRYVLCDEIGRGGMATVHLGRLLGPVGFSRTVAIKQLRPEFAKVPELVRMFIDEARLAARVHHPNIVQTIDVVEVDGDLYLVMEYVHGESLARLIQACREAGKSVPPEIATAIVVGALQGIAGAHNSTNERGEPLELVHRDISPQNVLVGADGVPRLLDFGIAKAVGRLQSTREGQIKGKLSYMAPEQVRGRAVDGRTDLFAMSIVLWEVLTGERLFAAEDGATTMTNVLEKIVPRPSTFESAIPTAIDAVVMRGLSRRPADRFATAQEMIDELERAVTPATTQQIRRWVESLGGERLRERARIVARAESESFDGAGAASATEQPAAEESALQTVTDRTAPRDHRWKRWLAAAAALTLSSGFLAALALTRQHREPAAPPRVEATNAAPAETVSVLSTPAPTVAPPAATPSASPTNPRARVPRSVAPRPERPDCNPPYTIDSDGVRHPKPRCM
jgi:serine/threonine-protein kinase